jgi:hypothetical protein
LLCCLAPVVVGFYNINLICMLFYKCLSTDCNVALLLIL